MIKSNNYWLLTPVSLSRSIPTRYHNQTLTGLVIFLTCNQEREREREKKEKMRKNKVRKRVE